MIHDNGDRTQDGKSSIPLVLTIADIERPRRDLTVQGPAKPRRTDAEDTMRHHRWVIANLHRVGYVGRITITMIPDADEYLTDIVGPDGMLTVTGYVAGAGGTSTGERLLVDLLARAGKPYLESQVFGSAHARAVERTWACGGFRERELELRRVRR
jgi:hypothetical protein